MIGIRRGGSILQGSEEGSYFLKIASLIPSCRSLNHKISELALEHWVSEIFASHFASDHSLLFVSDTEICTVKKLCLRNSQLNIYMQVSVLKSDRCQVKPVCLKAKLPSYSNLIYHIVQLQDDLGKIAHEQSVCQIE